MNRIASYRIEKLLLLIKACALFIRTGFFYSIGERNPFLAARKLCNRFSRISKPQPVAIRGVKMKKNFNHFSVILAAGVFLLLSISGNSAYGASTNLLGWGPDQAANWEQMKQENHYLWQHLKAQADNPSIYADDGLRDALVYLITGNTDYANEAYLKVSYYAGRTKPGIEPSGRDETRLKFSRMAMMYNWISDALSPSDRSNFRDILEHWCDLCLDNQPPWGTRPSDSDETVGHYFGIVIFALALSDEDPARSAELLNLDPNNSTPPVGGLDATGANFKTLRNTIAAYAKKAAGGQWMESSQYNLGTVQLLISGVEAINNYLGEDKFPEITALYPEIANAFVQELTPDFQDSYQWGDIQEAHDLWYYHRNPLMSMVAGITKDPEVLYTIWDKFYFEYYPTICEGGVFLYADPYSTRKQPSGLSYNYSSGRGLAFYHLGWDADDSFYGTQMFNHIGVDHEMESLNNFVLYRNGGWALTTPVGYINLDDSPFSNTLMVSGAFGRVKEARGEIAFEAGDDYVYHVGTLGGAVYESTYYQPPDETVHEWTRSTLFHHNIDGSDSIIVFDRVNADNPHTFVPQWKFDRYRDREKNRLLQSDGKHQWIIHMPESPNQNGNVFSWQASNSEEVFLQTYMMDYTAQIIDELEHRSYNANPSLMGGTISQNELKYQLRLIPDSTETWQTFLNIVHVGGAFTTQKFLSESGEEAVGLLLDIEGGLQSILAIFNATKGPYIEPSPPDMYGNVPHDYGKLNDIAQSHYFKTGFNLSVETTASQTEVFMMDLDVNKGWSVSIDGAPSLLNISSEGLVQFNVENEGVHQISLYIDNQCPIAVIADPVINSMVVDFDGSQSYDPDGDPIEYLWDFGDNQSSTEKSPTHTYAVADNYTVILTVSDLSLNDIDTKTITVGQVNQGPSLDPIPGESIEEQKELTIQVNATDPDGDPVNLSVQLSDGSEISSVGASFVDNGNGTGEFSWMPTSYYVGEELVFVFKASDGNLEDIESVVVTVTQDADNVEFHWLEAEFADDVMNPMEVQSDSLASQEQYIYTQNGSGNYSSAPEGNAMATYSVDIDKEGKYILWARVISPSEVDNSFWVQIDEGTDNLWDLPYDSNWYWKKVSNRNGADPVKFDLTQGTHTIKIKVREDGAKIDKLFLTNEQTYLPTGIGGEAENVPGEPEKESHWLEAEYPESIVSPMQVKSDSSSSESKYVFVPNGHGNYYSPGSVMATYSVNVQYDGEFVLWARVIAPSGVDDSFFVQIDDGSDNLWDVPLNSSWDWNKASDRNGASPVVFQLTKGAHIIKIKAREDGTKIDKILLTSDMDLIPSGLGELADNIPEQPAEESHWLEAEYANSIASPMQQDDHASSSEGQYIHAPNGSGSYTSGPTAVMATYDVNIDQAGEYVLWGRVISPSEVDNSFYVQIDQGDNNLWDLPYDSNWYWKKISNRNGADPVIFVLSKGVHTIKIKAREDGAKIDKLFLTNNFDYVPSGVGETAENIPSGSVVETHWLEAEYADSIAIPPPLRVPEDMIP